MYGRNIWAKLVLAGAAALVMGAPISFADSMTVKTLSANASTGVFQYQITLDGGGIAPGHGFAIYGSTNGAWNTLWSSGVSEGDGPALLSQFASEMTSSGYAGALDNSGTTNALGAVQTYTV